MNTYEKNLEMFRKYDRKLYEVIINEKPIYSAKITPCVNLDNSYIIEVGNKEQIINFQDINDQLELYSSDKDAEIVILYGVGTVVTLKSIVESFKNMKHLVIIEPCLEYFILMLTKIDLADQFKDINIVTFILNKSEAEACNDLSFLTQQFEYYNRVEKVCNKYINILFHEYYNDINKFIVRCIHEYINKINLMIIGTNCVDNSDITIKHNLGNLISKQFINGKFNRMDTIVRYLAIEQYYGENTYGFELYNKMQYKRGASIHNIERFINLIKQIEENGFDFSNEVVVGPNFSLYDGSHRLACAIYWNLDEISIKISLNAQPVEYSIEWFEKNDFTKEEIKIIEDKAMKIFEKLGLFFVAILWPPVENYFDEITSDISKDYAVVSVNDYTYENDFEFSSIIKGIYKIDDIENWKIEKKISGMQNYNKKLRVIKFNIKEPKFRKKAVSGKPISVEVENIKKKYRNKYYDKIDNYFYDVIIHIGDNYDHSDHMIKVLNKNIDISSFLQKIRSYDYALIKVDVPYMPQDFPLSYPLSKDLDIICSSEHYNELCSVAENFTLKYNKYYTIKKVNRSDNMLLRFELNGFLCYQIDISKWIDGFGSEFTINALRRRVDEGSYYTLDARDEVLIRAKDYERHRWKNHHLQYVMSHKELLEEEYFANFMKICHSKNEL